MHHCVNFNCLSPRLLPPGDSFPHVLRHSGWVFLSRPQRHREQKGGTRSLPGVTHLSRNRQSTSQEPSLQHNTTQPEWSKQTPSSSSRPPTSCTCCLTGIPLYPYCNHNQLKSLHLYITERSRNEEGTHETPWETPFLSSKESNPAISS